MTEAVKVTDDDINRASRDADLWVSVLLTVRGRIFLFQDYSNEFRWTLPIGEKKTGSSIPVQELLQHTVNVYTGMLVSQPNIRAVLLGCQVSVEPIRVPGEGYTERFIPGRQSVVSMYHLGLDTPPQIQRTGSGGFGLFTFGEALSLRKSELTQKLFETWPDSILSTLKSSRRQSWSGN